MNASPLDVGEMTVRDDPEGPGSQLREARLRTNFSVEEISSELHLNADTVRALEENRFESLPAPTFVRGYLRSYARLLNLPPGPILEGYDRKGFTPPTIVADITQQPQVKSTDVPVRLATYLVAAGLVVMVSMWWQSREAPPGVSGEIAPLAATADPAPSKPAVTEASAADPASTRLPAAQTVRDIGDTGSGDVAAPAAESTGSLAALSGAMAIPVDPAPMAPAPSGQAESPPVPGVATLAPVRDEPAPPESDSAGSAVSATNGESSAAPAGRAESAIPNHRLGLAFDQESWVEVYDGNGDRLVYRLAIEGERMILEAEPPIRVVLGYAAGARITFNDRDLDVTPFMQRGMARFLVAADGTARAPAPAAGNAGTPATAAAESELPSQN